MCGRYAQTMGAEEIVTAFSLDGSTVDHSLPLNWNIAPTNEDRKSTRLNSSHRT